MQKSITLVFNYFICSSPSTSYYTQVIMHSHTNTLHLVFVLYFDRLILFVVIFFGHSCNEFRFQLLILILHHILINLCEKVS